MMTADFVQNIKDLIDETKAKGVELIAVTKTVDAETINDAIKCGITHIGENKVQELLSKYDYLLKENLTIHLIGKLQTNKVKYIIDKVDFIHSVDSIKLAETIDKYAKKIDKIQDILIQINISGEESKSGISPSELAEFLTEISKLSNLRVRGLMCIPAPETFFGENEPYFNNMHKMFVDINDKKIDNINMDILSMGMSNDYKTAINCGATMVRIGTKIFGKRNYTEVQL